jgi:tetratricopeptide (TPR) repeat protein
MRPWEVSLYAMRAQARETLLDYRGAFADYEAIHRLQGERGEPLKEMARLAAQAGKAKADEEHYRELAEIAAPREPRRDEGLPMDRLSAERLLLYAGYAESLGKRDLELLFLDAAHRVQYDNVRTLEMMAALTRSVGIVSQLIALNPSRADYFVMRYELYPSLYDASAIIGLEPYEGKSYARRAELLVNRGGPGDPIADYRRAIDLEPSNAEYCYGMSKVYQKRGAFLLQTLALNWALVGEPDNAEWLKERAALP